MEVSREAGAEVGPIGERNCQDRITGPARDRVLKRSGAFPLDLSMARPASFFADALLLIPCPPEGPSSTGRIYEYQQQLPVREARFRCPFDIHESVVNGILFHASTATREYSISGGSIVEPTRRAAQSCVVAT